MAAALSSALAERSSWGLVVALLRGCARTLASSVADSRLPEDVASCLAAVREAAGMASPAIALVRPLSAAAHSARQAQQLTVGVQDETPPPEQQQDVSSALLLARHLLQAALDKLHEPSPRALC